MGGGYVPSFILHVLQCFPPVSIIRTFRESHSDVAGKIHLVDRGRYRFRWCALNSVATAHYNGGAAHNFGPPVADEGIRHISQHCSS